MQIPEYQNYQEGKKHGRGTFLFDTYLCTIPQDFQKVPIHWHEDIELIYVKKGKGLVSVNLTEYEVESGSIVLILPGQLHAIYTKNLQRMEYENIIFSPDLLRSGVVDICETEYLFPLLSGGITLPVHFKKGMEAHEEISRILDACDQIGKEKKEGSEFLIKSMIFQIFYVFINRCSHSGVRKVIPRDLDRMKKVMKYIEDHYSEKISIAEIAGEVGCAPSYFMRIFKKNIGVSFIEYLNDFRIDTGARLLKETSSSIMEIAMKVGFDNLSYFNRSFKKKYKVSPGQFRKQ